MNPATIAKYGEAFIPSHAKDDPTDAEIALDLLLRHREKLQHLKPQSAAMRALTTLVEQRRSLVGDKTRITNRLRFLLLVHSAIREVVGLAKGGGMSTRTAAIIVKFKRDTLTTVSQVSVRRMARKLGLNQAQVLHYALAHLRDELFSRPERLVLASGEDDDDCPVLTLEQLLSSNTGV